MASLIKALFCDPFGPNLRIAVAHGLLDQNASKSSFSFYVWWRLLKVVFNSFVAAIIRKQRVGGATAGSR